MATSIDDLLRMLVMPDAMPTGVYVPNGELPMRTKTLPATFPTGGYGPDPLMQQAMGAMAGMPKAQPARVKSRVPRPRLPKRAPVKMPRATLPSAIPHVEAGGGYLATGVTPKKKKPTALY